MHNHNTQTPQQNPTTEITPETAFLARVASDAVISADGKQVAFVLATWVPDQAKARHRIWTVGTSGTDEPRPLNSGLAEESTPRWSPTGSSLAFIGRATEEKDLGKPQLYLVTPGSESPATTPLSALPEGVSDPQWSPDGSQLAFLSQESNPNSVDPRVIGPRGHTRLWIVRPSAAASPVAITPSDLTVRGYSWSPDGTLFAVYFTTGSEETDWYRGQIGIVSISDGEIHQISHLTRQACDLSWSPDGSQITYISGEWSDPDRGDGDIYVQPLASGAAHNLTPGITISPSWCRWFPDGKRLLYVAGEGVSHQIGILEAETGKTIPLSKNFTLGDRHWPHLSTTPDLQQFVTTRTEQHAPDIWFAHPDELHTDGNTLHWQQLTHLNPQLEADLKLYPTRQIRYTSIDGWEIDALLVLPETKDRTRPPLIVNIHGGPSSAWLNDWDRYRTQMLAAAGYAVLRPNIRGSLGRGVAFADAVIGDMGGKDLQDLLFGIDYLIEQGLVDSERVGIMGWSYGGFMSAWAITQTRRFKAAVMGAGICDFHSFHAQTNIPDWDMRFLSKEIVNPYEHADLYRRSSAITHVRSVTTPTLIIHGEADECVPVNQAYAFYRALHERDIPTELVTYPREGHGFTERAHIQDYHERVLRWFNTYLR